MKRINFIIFLLGSIVNVGCSTNQQVDFSMIETPSAIRHRVWTGEVNYQAGAIRDTGDILDITDLDGGVMFSYPLGNQIPMSDLTGAAFSLESVPGELSGYMAVLEFTFPVSSYGPGTEYNWSVTPHLICRYEIDDNNSTPNEAFASFEYIVLEDSLGQFDLLENASINENLFNALESSIEGEKKYFFIGDANGTLVVTHDERSGTIISAPGYRPRLFIGVSVQISAGNTLLDGLFTPADKILVGGNSLPTRVNDPDRCTINFGTNSYYTMKPKPPGN